MSDPAVIPPKKRAAYEAANKHYNDYLLKNLIDIKNYKSQNLLHLVLENRSYSYIPRDIEGLLTKNESYSFFFAQDQSFHLNLF
jgi:hypothetical protein